MCLFISRSCCNCKLEKKMQIQVHLGANSSFVICLICTCIVPVSQAFLCAASYLCLCLYACAYVAVIVTVTSTLLLIVAVYVSTVAVIRDCACAPCLCIFPRFKKKKSKAAIRNLQFTFLIANCQLPIAHSYSRSYSHG